MYNNNPYYGDSSNAPQSFMNTSVLDSYATQAWSNSQFLKRTFSQIGQSTISLPTSSNSSGVQGQFSLSTSDYSECVYALELSASVSSSYELNIIVSGFLPSNKLSIMNNVTLLNTGLGNFQKWMRNVAYDTFLIDDSTLGAKLHIVIDYINSDNVNHPTLYLPSGTYDDGINGGTGNLAYRIYGYAPSGTTAKITVFGR